MLFTPRRVLFVDYKRNLLSGRKTEFTSVPYTSISHFAVITPGWGTKLMGIKVGDHDAELKLWTDARYWKREV